MIEEKLTDISPEVLDILRHEIAKALAKEMGMKMAMIAVGLEQEDKHE